MSTWQSMMRISDAQIEEIKTNSSLLDVFLYTTGKRTREERLADIQERGTHDVFQVGNGYVVAPKNSNFSLISERGVNVIIPIPNISTVPWYQRWWYAMISAITRRPSPFLRPIISATTRQPSLLLSPANFKKAKNIEKTAPPTVPPHWQPFECDGQCNLDQEFELIFYLFSDCKIPGTKPLNFMLGSLGQTENPDKGYLFIAAAKVEEIIAAVDSVPEETLRKRYDNKERLTSLGCSYAYEHEGTEYDEYIGTMIADMRRFLLRVREKGDGILIQLS
jgi:hypothetical protein